jgi:hypothetical protein
MHKSLNADNTPIGWIQMFGGLVFQRMPITVLSARLKAEEAGKHRYDADENFMC